MGADGFAADMAPVSEVAPVTSWAANDAIDYAADGLRVVAQAIHESCSVTNQDSNPQSTLNQCLFTVLKVYPINSPLSKLGDTGVHGD